MLYDSARIAATLHDLVALEVTSDETAAERDIDAVTRISFGVYLLHWTVKIQGFPLPKKQWRRHPVPLTPLQFAQGLARRDASSSIRSNLALSPLQA